MRFSSSHYRTLQFFGFIFSENLKADECKARAAPKSDKILALSRSLSTEKQSLFSWERDCRLVRLQKVSFINHFLGLPTCPPVALSPSQANCIIKYSTWTIWSCIFSQYSNCINNLCSRKGSDHSSSLQVGHVVWANFSDKIMAGGPANIVTIY